jgi:N-carbamoyl-L-amino-acid hydrolase
MTIELDRERLVALMEAQAEIGGTDRGGLHRLTLTDEDKRARDWLLAEMETAGLDVRVDEFGNMFGRRPGTDPDAAPVLVGSHLDSQPYGGMYDGALGTVAALEFVKTLNDDDIETAHPVEVVNWTNEEGARFKPPMMGSGVWAGTYDLEETYARTDEDGRTVEAELERIGYKGSVPAEPREEYEAYLELHIEQGPELEQRGLDVGVVKGIVGLTWTETTFSGTANHTGPTPIHFRNDALVPAGELITEVRRVAQRLGPAARGTVGNLEYDSEAISIVPDEVNVVWEIVHPDDDVVQEGYERMLAEVEQVASREGVDHESTEISRFESVRFDERCMRAIERAADDLGYGHTRLFAGAGHDPSNVSQVCDTAMVFAVSEDGLSHTEAEFTSWDDCYSSATTLANAALRLASAE